MLEEFRITVAKLTGKLPKIISTTRAKRVNVFDKKLIKELKQINPSFRKRLLKNGEFPPAKIPEETKNLDKNKLKRILQIWFSMEGGVTLSARRSKPGFISLTRKGISF